MLSISGLLPDTRPTHYQTNAPQLRPKTGPMTGLSLRLWHDGRVAPVEGGGTLAEGGRAPDSGLLRACFLQEKFGEFESRPSVPARRRASKAMRPSR